MAKGFTVDTDRWQRAKDLFGSALEHEPGQRNAFLAEACGGDESLRREVESLLAVHQDAATTMGGTGLPESGGAMSAPEDLVSGRRIGPYQVNRRIGQGGMAAVYLAIRADDQYKRLVAIKLILPGLDSEDLLRRFRNERQTLAALDHPNIVKLLDGGATEDGLPYLVMDYAEGTPLDEYCDHHKLSIDERLQLFRTVCAAVSYAHQRLVIHRDLKPGNILVCFAPLTKTCRPSSISNSPRMGCGVKAAAVLPLFMRDRPWLRCRIPPFASHPSMPWSRRP
jgi:hypothetical protein